ncbi:MAG: hypothetical protein ACFBSG_06920 [Leptolyngbyaceae cyanobacterium]
MLNNAASSSSYSSDELNFSRDNLTDVAPLAENTPAASASETSASEATATGALLEFALIDTTTDEVVPGYERLTDGDTIDLKGLTDTRYTIRAIVNAQHADAQTVESVKFETNTGQQIENIAPYAMFGNRGDDYAGKVFDTGVHRLSVTAYSADGAKGDALATIDLSYLVVDTAPDVSTGGGDADTSDLDEFDQMMAALDALNGQESATGAGLTVAVNDSTVETISGSEDDDTLSIRTHTGTSTTTTADAGSDRVILYGSEAIPEGNYHDMLADLKANPMQTAADYFGATHRVDLGADNHADNLDLVSELGARPQFMLKHTQADGRINGAGVAGENNAAYDHWAGVFGLIDISNFDASRDAVKLAGHTTTLGDSFTQDGDFYQTVFSEQNANDQSGPRAGAAHDDTFLGLLRFEDGAADGAAISEAITVDGMRTFVIKGLGQDVFEDDPTDNQVGDAITDKALFTFALVNSDTNEVVQTLTDGAEIDLNGLGVDQFSVVAQVNPDHFYASEVESVQFESNLGNQTENLVPYALFGDIRGDYRGRDLDVGEVSLTATAFSRDRGQGKEIASASLDYTIVDTSDASVDSLTGIAASDSLTGDMAQTDELTNTSLTMDTIAAGSELLVDPLVDELAIAATESTMAESAIVGTSDGDSEATELDPFGDALPVCAQPSLMEPAYSVG